MRRLFIVRHAKAHPLAEQDDYERMLTDRGRADAKRIAAALVARKMLPDILIHSGALRAKETAEILAAEWPRDVKLREELALYNATQGALFERSRALPNSLKRVGFVGHNPGLAELAVALARLESHPDLRRGAVKFPTCAVAALDFAVDRWKDVERNSATLALYLTPSELETATD
jgi:phosphohistidine phosphatase